MKKVYFRSTIGDPYSDRGFTEMNKIRKAMTLCGGQKMDHLAGWIEVPADKVEMAKTLLSDIKTLKDIQVKDSITEDAEQYRGFKIYKVSHAHDTDWEVENSDGVQWNYDGSMSLQEVKRAIDEGLRTGNWDDPFTENGYAISASPLFWSIRTEKDATSGRITDILLKVKDYLTHFKNKLKPDEQWEAMLPKYIEAGKKFGLNVEALTKAVDFVEHGKGNPWEDSITEDDASHDDKQFLLATYNNYCKGKTYADIQKMWTELRRVMTAYKNGIFKWSTYSWKSDTYIHAVVSGNDSEYRGSPKVWLVISLDFEKGYAKVVHEIDTRVSFKQEFTIPKIKKDSITEDEKVTRHNII